MIFTDRTITVKKGVSSIDDTIVLYRGDKEVEIRFTLNESSPFRFGIGAEPNIIEKTEAAYGQLVIRTPNDLPSIFSEIVPTNEGKIIFTITAEMIDEITEVGNYTFQIRLLDENMNSRATLPEVVNGIEIREPIATEDVSTSNEVGVAAVGYAMTTAGTTEDAFDTQGNYNKTTWGTGDRITAAKLNKIEAGIDGVNQKVASGSTGGETGVDLSIYQTKTDNTLNTTNKTVSGAINEINEAMVIAEEQTGDITVGEVPVGGSNKASDITITDTAGNYTSNNVEGALQEVGSQIKEKANKNDLIIQSKRIDNLIAVENSTDNAETADIRMGEDGIIYNSAGEAVRIQIGNIKDNFDCGNNKYNYKHALKACRVDTTNGKLVENFPYQFASDFIKICGDKLYIKDWINSDIKNAKSSIVGAVAFYSDPNENSFISGVINSKHNGSTIPDGANYLRFSFGTTNGEVSNKIIVSFIDIPYEDYYVILNGSKYVTLTEVKNEVGNILASSTSAFSCNIKGFGAKGDGVTDDREAIQSALNYASEHGGGTVFVPSGEYFISNSLIVHSNTTLLGENKWKSIIQLDTTKKGVPLLNCSGTEDNIKENIVVNRLHLKHNQGSSGIDSTTGGNCLIFANYIKMSTFKDNVLSDYCGCGIYVSHTMPLGSTWSLNIKDNIIMNNVMQNYTSGILLDELAEYVEVSGNRVQYALIGIELRNCANDRIINNTVSSEQIGIKYTHTKVDINGGKHIISNNTINHCSGGGVYIEGMCSTSILKQGGCTINCNMALLDNNYGIKVLGGIGHIISNNRIITSEVADPGVYLGDNSTHKASYCLIQNNSIMCDKSSSTGIIDVSNATGEGNNVDNNMLIVKP